MSGQANVGWISLAEAAAELGVSGVTVRRLIDRGEITAERRGRGARAAIFVSTADIATARSSEGASVGTALAEREDRLTRIANALARLDGHTCHEGHSDAEHLAMYRSVLAEVRDAVGGGA